MLNHIPAIVDQQRLSAAMEALGISVNQLLSNRPDKYLELVFLDSQQLECLDRQHRIQARQEFLSLGDKWWTVDLYVAGIDKLFYKN